MPGEDIFSTLSPEHLALIAEHGVTRQYAKSTVLITEGDQSDSLYVILSGKVRVYLSDENGKEFTLNVHGPNEYFGELALWFGVSGGDLPYVLPNANRFFSPVSGGRPLGFLI